MRDVLWNVCTGMCVIARLSSQILGAVEIIIRDACHPEMIDPEVVYRASLSVVMRLFLIKCAEYRGLGHALGDLSAQLESRLGNGQSWQSIENIFEDYGLPPVEPALSELFSDDILSEVLGRIELDYSQIGPEIPGYVYEGLIGYTVSGERSGTLSVVSTRKRSETGSFYTPQNLVVRMVEEALKPLLEKNSGLDLRDLKICDPAMGTGAFLVQICRELAERISAFQGEGSQPEQVGKTLRWVAENCLYGVDLNPTAVEVAKLTILLLAAKPGDSVKAIMSSLDAHLRCGNSLELDWQEMFPEIMGSGGFDVVIGNPPYGVPMHKEEMKGYRHRFDCLEKRFDIYMPFLVLGLNLTRGSLVYVTPDKWLSKSFGEKFRQKYMVGEMIRVFHLGDSVFSHALVDSIVTVFKKNPGNMLEIFVGEKNGDIRLVSRIDRREIEPPYLIDSFFREPSGLVLAMEKQEHILEEYGHCEYGMVGPTAYQLKPLIHEYNPEIGEQQKILNTGLIGKYVNRWLYRDMKYLRGTYKHPAVRREDLERTFGETFCHRIYSPKIIIKGLNLLDASLDLKGEFMSTVATLNIRLESAAMLMVLAAILNSGVVKEYFGEKYFTGGYCGGMMFTPYMLNHLPVPDLSDLGQWEDVTEGVSRILEASTEAEFGSILRDLECCIRSHYGLG